MTATVLLLDPETVIHRLSYPDDDADVREAVEGALASATQTISSAIRDDFSRVTVVDRFLVQQSLNFGTTGRTTRTRVLQGDVLRGQTALQTKLQLSRGLVDLGQTYTVRASASWAHLDEPSSRVDLRNVNGDDLVAITAEAGDVRILDYEFHNTYVEVAYTAGLVADGADPSVYQSVPGWLQELAFLRANIILNANPVIATAAGVGGNTEATRDSRQKDLRRRVSELELAHARYRPMWHKPIHTVETSA